MALRWMTALVAVALLGGCSSTPEEPKAPPPEGETTEGNAESAGDEEATEAENSATPAPAKTPVPAKAKPTPKATAAGKTPAAPKPPAPEKEPAPVTPPEKPKVPEKAQESGKNAAIEVVLPDLGTLHPLFPYTSSAVMPPVVKLVGQDAATAEQTDFRPEATKARVQKIVQHQKSAKAALEKKDPKALADALAQSLGALRQHALYLEYLMGTGGSDPVIKEPALQYTKVCEQILKAAAILKRQPGTAVMAHTYTGDALACQLRAGDSSALATARDYLKTNGSTPLGIRVRLIGGAEDFVTGNFRGSFGRIQDLLETPQTPLSRAGLLILSSSAAERRGDHHAAQAQLVEALRLASPLLGRTGNPSPLVAALAEKLTRLAMNAKSSEPDSTVAEALKSIGTPQLSRAYVEQSALAMATIKPAAALARYVQLESLAPLQPSDRIRLEARLVDLAVRSQAHDAVLARWTALLKASEGQKVRGMPQLAEQTRAALLKQVRPETLDAIVAVHDLLRARIPEYKSNEKAEIEILSTLVRLRPPAVVMQRAERLASESKQPETKKQTLMIALRARERVLGLKEAPDWRPEIPKTFHKEGAAQYVKTLDSLEAATSAMEEKEWAAFQSAFVLFLAADLEEARKRIEKAVTSFPGSRHAARGIYFFVKNASDMQDPASMERLARVADKAMLLPPDKGLPEFKTLVAQALLDQGRALAAAKRHDDAIAKFRACGKEFPRSPKAVECRMAEASTLESQGKLVESMAAYENVAKHPSAANSSEEASWKSAVLAEKAGDWPKAAAAYESYAKAFPQAMARRKVWLMGARAHRKAGDLVKASDRYALHQKSVTDREEKFHLLKEVASLYEERKIAKTALHLHGQCLELLKWVPKAPESDEELRIRSRMAELHLVENDSVEARRQLEKAVTLSARTREGAQLSSGAKYRLGEIIFDELLGQLEAGKSFASIIDTFDKGRRLVLAECEMPESRRCAESQFQSASMAYSIYRTYAAADAEVKAREPSQAKPRILGLKPQIQISLAEAKKALKEGSAELRRQIDELAEATKKLP